MTLPDWMTRLPWDHIRKAADDYKFDPLILAAIIQQESAGDPFAIRYEPNWDYEFNLRHFADLNRITVKTEKVCQSCSWGLMQIMGTVARELGHDGPLTKLVDIEINLRLGAKKLKDLAYKRDTEEDMIASYNAGHAQKKPSGMYVNQRYVDKVCGYLRELRKLN